MAQGDDRPTESPTGDVKYDQAALRDAEQKMHAGGTGQDDDSDPEGGHDAGALKDAAEKMKAEPKK
jgi:hypothetical protein